MFKSKSSKNNIINNDAYSANTIQNGTILKGEVESESNIRVDGRLEGTLITKGKLVVGETGVIVGDVKCENANIEGRIEGELIVNELLVLKQNATINGSIKTKKIVVEEGAVFNGSVKTGEQSQLKNTKKEDDQEEFQKEAV